MIKSTSKNIIERKWHLIDAKGQVLGRLSSGIVKYLLGKNKPYFTPSLDCGDHVVVINAKDIVLTGKKLIEKKYLNYSGYPGGLRTRSASVLLERKPEEMIELAVLNMLPKNKLRTDRLGKLHVFAGSEHTYSEQFIPKKEKSGKLSKKENKETK